MSHSNHGGYQYPGLTALRLVANAFSDDAFFGLLTFALFPFGNTFSLALFERTSPFGLTH